MDRVEEIANAIAELPPDDYKRLADWFHAMEQERWDEQLDKDASNGRLDFLFQEGEAESAQRLVREWPPQK